MSKKKVDTAAIDENLLMESIRGGVSTPSPVPVPASAPVPVSTPEPSLEPASVFVEPAQNKVVVVPNNVENPSELSEVTVEPPKEDSRSKLEKLKEYESLFIKESNLVTRLGKPVYIRREFHDRMQKIVYTIGDNELSIAAYLDNVIAHHFNMFQAEITLAYKKKVKDIF
jgi:hypothetical protein